MKATIHLTCFGAALVASAFAASAAAQTATTPDPHGLAFAGGKLWFTAEGARAVGRYDPASSRVDWVLGTGQDRTHMLDVSADTQRVITTNVNAGTVTVMDQESGRRPGPPPGGPRTTWGETVVPVGRGAEGFDVSPDGRVAWVANAGDGTISVIDLGAQRVVRTLDAGVRGATRLKFPPDGALVFVSTLGGPDVTVLRAATGAVVNRVPVGPRGRGDPGPAGRAARLRGVHARRARVGGGPALKRRRPVPNSPAADPTAVLIDPDPDELDPKVEALVHELIGRVADKWTMIVLEVLAEHGTLRFTRLGELAGGISQKMLTQTVRQMERDGLLIRTVHPVIPPKVEYRLTDLGMSLGEAFCSVWIWAAQNRQRIEDARRAFDDGSRRS